MRIKLLAPLFVISILVLLQGCTAAPVQKVIIKIPKQLTSEHKVRPVAIQKVIAKIPRGTVIGSIEGGLACILQKPYSDIQWQSGGQVNFTTEELVDIFREELESAGWPVVGTTDNMFESDISEAELLIGAKIEQLQANVCYPMAGFGDYRNGTGEMFMKVEWQLYSPRTKKVIGSIRTEGGTEIKSKTSMINQDLIANSFSIAARNLLADEKFFELVKKSDRAKVVAAGNKIILKNPTPNDIFTTSLLSDSKKSVVSIRTASSHGTGFSVGDGTKILTNAHVVGHAKNITVVTSDGMTFEAKVIRVNKERDIALIDLGSITLLPLPISNIPPKVGSELYAIGSPFKEEFSGTLTRGIHSGSRTFEDLTWIQSDVSVNPGNSGGPLLDEKANVVGITTLGLGGAGSGLNLFVPIEDGLKFLSIEMR